MIDQMLHSLLPKQLLDLDWSALITQAWTELSQDLKQFIHAVDWDESFIMGLAAFHLTVFIWILISRSRQITLILTVMILGVMALLSESINALANSHYLLFSKQNYFDKSGIFVVTMFALPILVNILVALAFIVVYTLKLMVQAKRSQLRQHILSKADKDK
ncbi:Transmembrane protein 18 [Batrachochytrium dendrobatidis]